MYMYMYTYLYMYMYIFRGSSTVGETAHWGQRGQEAKIGAESRLAILRREVHLNPH